MTTMDNDTKEPNIMTSFHVENDRFENMGRALQHAYMSQIKGKTYRQEYGLQNNRRVQVGDYIVSDGFDN